MFESINVTTTESPVLVADVAAAPVAEVTLGRQTFNDSDKSNYFEG